MPAIDIYKNKSRAWPAPTKEPQFDDRLRNTLPLSTFTG